MSCYLSPKTSFEKYEWCERNPRLYWDQFWNVHFHEKKCKAVAIQIVAVAVTLISFNSKLLTSDILQKNVKNKNKYEICPSQHVFCSLLSKIEDNCPSRFGNVSEIITAQCISSTIYIHLLHNAHMNIMTRRLYFCLNDYSIFLLSAMEITKFFG